MIKGTVGPLTRWVGEDGQVGGARPNDLKDLIDVEEFAEDCELFVRWRP